MSDLRLPRKAPGVGSGHADCVSLSQARERALEAARLRRQGIDPKIAWAPERASREAVTFGALALEVIADRKAGWKNAKHAQQWENTLATYAAPIWDMPVGDVDIDDVLGILRPIWNVKQETSRRVQGRLRAVLDVAKVKKLRVGENPAAWAGNLALILASQPKGPKRHQPAMPYASVPAFMVSLREREELSARALELTILTAARTTEVRAACWDEFDLDNAVWTIPAGRMKAKIEHRVALSDQAIKLLRALPRQSAFLFPGLKANKPMSQMTMLQLLRRMNLGHFTVHGFRSSFRDFAGEETDFPRELAEHALAHSIGNEVERAYRRGDALLKRRELMQAWADYLDSETAYAVADPNDNPNACAGCGQTRTHNGE